MLFLPYDNCAIISNLGFLLLCHPGIHPFTRFSLLLLLELPDLAHKTIRCPVKFKYQINTNDLFFSINVCVSCSVVSDSLQPQGLYSTPGSSVHQILQARILEWVAISFSRGSSPPPRVQTRVSCITGRFLTV